MSDRHRNHPIFLSLLQLLFCVTYFSGVRSNENELHILLQLKSALETSNSSAFETWRSDSSPCNFTGITCISAQSVIGIDLNGRGLAGIIPLDSICKLPSLQKLAIGLNSLYGNVSGDLKNCNQLQYLDLASNRLTGTVPDLSNLTGLKILNLSANGFSGFFPWNSLRNLTDLLDLRLGDNPFEKSSFPNEVFNLRKLYWLYLSNCSLQGEIPQGIGNLTELVNLELSSNHLTGEIPSGITKLLKLTQVELYENYLVGKFPIGFGNLSNLEYFDASSNSLEGDLQELRFLTKLVSLQLFNNTFSGEIPMEFGNFRSLVNLSLYSNRFSGSLPQTLGSSSEFDYIDVSNNLFTGSIPPDMCKRGKMTRLLILYNMFSGQIPDNYANCKTLTRFRVSNNNLSGQIPSKLWGLPNLDLIDLKFNQLEGPVTSDIANATSISQLCISNNKFSGKLPPEISKATSLFAIDVSFNQFSGEIPSSIGQLKNLNQLYLHKNMFSGPIPDSLSSCRSIAQINMAENLLSGQIPPSLGSLKSLNSLNLSNNHLSGEIPSSLSSLRLSLLDLSNDRLTGPVPQSLSIQAYINSFAGNPGLCSQYNPYLRPCLSDSGKSRQVKTLISCIFAGTALLLVLFGCFLFLKKRKNDKERRLIKRDSWDLKSFTILNFTEQEILNSVKEENLIGKGGSGNVYKVVLGSGKEIAVKHIWNTNSGTGGRSSYPMLEKRPAFSPEFDAEVMALSSIRHVNVVKLYCSITSEDSNLLVYEYLPNGSLWDRMHTCQNQKELEWGTRYEIALGAAKGLEYLHHGCERPIIHRDVKSSNILLDEFFKPRIADFGLAKIVRASDMGNDSTHVIAGTHGYIAPEYAYTYKVNEKSDVYSFGVVLMELLTGKRPIEQEFGNNKDIVYWISSRMTSRDSVMGLVDSRIPEAHKEDVIKVLKIAILCTARLPSLRPSMRTVVQMLEDVEPHKFITITVKDEKLRENKEKAVP
ncbi:receptor-like protein kinase 7 [Tasmannia lanceolata]|uniref:receptor-like protein kinase 7 n=1 Tax=Tasmannia lanceolata TaxID=3420 RepID=UPI004063A100